MHAYIVAFVCDSRISTKYSWLMCPKLFSATLLQKYPFCAPVTLTFCDLCYTNPAERDTEHSFLVYFSSNTQAQSQWKWIMSINIYAGPLHGSGANFTPRSILCIASYSTVHWVLHGVCCVQTVGMALKARPGLCPAVCSGATQPTRDKWPLGATRVTNAAAGYNLLACRGQRWKTFYFYRHRQNFAIWPPPRFMIQSHSREIWKIISI